MQAFSISLWIVSWVLEGTILFRLRKPEFLSSFPFFFSYVMYLLLASLAKFVIYWIRPQWYATSYWFGLLIGLLAEFAVLVEISDHMFKPFPAIQKLGRLVNTSISTVFLLVYVIPSFLKPRPSSAAFIDFALRVSVIKGLIIASLVTVVRWYRLPVTKNVVGLMLGFATYLGVYIANLAAALGAGKTLYADTFRLILPLGSTLCIAVWAISMWRFEPLPKISRKTGTKAGVPSEALSDQLVRFNTVLTRLLRK